MDNRTTKQIQTDVNNAYADLPGTACAAQRDALWSVVDKGEAELERRRAARDVSLQPPVPRAPDPGLVRTR